MQTIKCVVVGDGAVGKVCIFGPFHTSRNETSYCELDLSPNFIHDEQVPQRIRSNGEKSPPICFDGENFNRLLRCLITTRSP
jgi:hypothetical protein